MADNTDRLGPIAEIAQNEIVSLASASGYFDRVNTHEPKSLPGTGLTFAVWCDGIQPIAMMSGLAVTSALLVFRTRTYLNMVQEPQDAIDIAAIRANTWMTAQYTQHFDIDEAWIDLLGAHSPGVVTLAGYLNLDGKMHRVMDTQIPFVAPDVWDQGTEEE